MGILSPALGDGANVLYCLTNQLSIFGSFKSCVAHNSKSIIHLSNPTYMNFIFDGLNFRGYLSESS